MHMCEALLCAFEATGATRYLERAYLLARRICVDLAAPTDGLIWEHYHQDWSHDWEYNQDDPQNLFRPYGYLPGHFVEWSKLLLIVERHRPESWLLPKAEQLFAMAMDEQLGSRARWYALHLCAGWPRVGSRSLLLGPRRGLCRGRAVGNTYR